VIIEDSKCIEDSKHRFISFPRKGELQRDNRKRKLFKIQMTEETLITLEIIAKIQEILIVF